MSAEPIGSRSPYEPVVFVATDEDAEQRLDRAIAARGIASRSAVQRWLEEGRIFVRGEAATSKTKLRTGDEVCVVPAPPPPSNAIPEDIPLTVLFEDDDLLVVDKPAGLVVHPAPGHSSGTLVNALLHHANVQDDPTANERPGIVHRLDRDTSGVMVVAKTVPAKEGLVALFQAHDLERAYLAIAVGTLPDAMTFDTLHGRHPRDRKRFTTKVSEGKRAVTHVRVRERFEGAVLVECRLETGRTHQIRVHLAEHGAPLLGDPVYGRMPARGLVREIADSLGRQALHAAVLGFVHPVTRARLRFETPPPPDFQASLEALRSMRDDRVAKR